MIGSLYKIWPWRNVISYRENSHGDQVPFQEASVWPAQYVEHTGEPSFLLGALALIGVGIVLVALLARVGPKSE
jgi:putative membrane protein